MSERFDNPLVAAAKAEVGKIRRELGFGVFDDRPPEYLAAVRVYCAVLDALDGVNCQRRDFREGRRSLAIAFGDGSER
jgi:hypothetical protein